ncbi:MAG TPA: NAD-dependent epimerase/dehydratase family protein [Vicinamibacteria bacterium]|nr:NAD-dependent epimerase/dehydratase family protein [Vicinamibacteria bacterium]
MTTRRELLKLTGAGALGLLARPSQGALTIAEEPAGRATKPLRILILGGTGFTGPHQVRYALARGHQLTLFNRGREKKQWPAPVEELVGDRNAGELEALAGREWDVCIDNPTTLPFWVRDAGQALKGKVKHYVFISTISVYASDATPGQDEAAPLAVYKGQDAMKETVETLRKDIEGLYGPLKALSEREAEKWFPGSTTIIRPGLIVGPGDESDRFTYWPVRLDRGGSALAPGDGSDPVQFVDARDLAEWTIRVAESRTLGTFNATGPASKLTMKAMLDAVHGAIASKASLVWVPASFLDQQKVSMWSDMPVWVPAAGDTAGGSLRRNQKAIRAGLSFRPLAPTARDTLAWFRTLPAERQGKLRAGVTPEREQQVLAAWQAAAKT